MIILASPNGFILSEPDDFSRFHVDANGLNTKELEILVESHAEWNKLKEDPQNSELQMLVRVSYLSDQVRADSRQGLARMLEYARSRGWLDPSGHWVKAHIVNIAGQED